MTEQESGHYLDRLDERQKAASTVQRNSVITAGAGAGKTTVLASRYIYLVVEKKIPVHSILALTFTRKAAAEMYERIYESLAAITTPWALEQLSDFQNAHITTLDSFCAEIVRQAARDYGYSPEFAIDDEKTKDIARGIAYRFVARNHDKPGIKETLQSFPFDSVASLLFGDLGASQVTPLALNEPYFSPMEKRLKALAAEKATETMRELRDGALAIVNKAAEASAPRADCLNAIDCSRTFIEAFGSAGKDRFALSDFTEYFSAFAKLAMRSYGRNEAEQSIKEQAKKAKEKAGTLLELADYEAMSASHSALLERLDMFASEVAEAKRLADVMDFKDLGACAVDILRRRKDLRAFWKSGIESIMIDEFQDNNELQKNLLYLLAEKKDQESDRIPLPENLEDGKLFFVGDEKQSIYRFRGADVAVFKRLSGELSGSETGEGSENIVLSSNYRSTLDLIGFFNEFFSFAMNDAGNDANNENDEHPAEKDYYAKYSSMSTGSPASQAAGFDSIVRYYLVNTDEDAGEESDEEPDGDVEYRFENQAGSETLGADDSLAFEIAQLIKNSCGALELRAGLDKESGKVISRKAEYADFAVLLRTTTNQHRLEKYFRLLDIPFDSETPRSLFRESPAHDIYNILKLAEDPGDRAAYAAVLRCPLCRVSDEAFLALMTREGDLFRPDEKVEFSDYDTLMLERAIGFFESLLLLADSAKVSDIVRYIWNYGGLRLDILSRPESMSFIEHFDYLFHIAAQIDRNRGGVADFIERIRPYIDGDVEKYEIENVPREAVSGVRILTIHKSKGLQFPVVILPWVENSGSTKRSQPLWNMLKEGLTVDIKPFDRPGAKASNIFFKLAKARENEMNDAEIKRLLYVACTRAEDHLFFFGKKPRKGQSSETSFMFFLEAFLEQQESRGGYAGSRLEKINLSCKATNDVRLWYKDRTRPSAREFLKAYDRTDTVHRDYLRRYLSATELNERSRDFISVYRKSGAETSEFRQEIPADATTMPIGDMPAIPADRFGSICHDAVEKAVIAGSIAGYAPSAELCKGINPQDITAAVGIATGIAERFLASEFWRSIPPFSERKVETPFILSLGEYLIEGRMDLRVETETELLIIDFKSDVVMNPHLYTVQLELYRRAAVGIAPGKTVRIALYWLRNATVSWYEKAMPDEYIKELAAYSTGQVGHSPPYFAIMPARTTQ